MKKIIILGLPGSGKSHLAREIGKNLNIKPIHLDRLFATPSAKNEPRAEWKSQMEQMVLEDSWIIDGRYSDSLPIRLAAADTVIFLDIPVWICLVRAWRRQGKERGDWPVDTPEKRDLEFFKLLWYVWSSRNSIVDEVYEYFERHARAAQLIHLAGRRSVKRFPRALR